MEEVKSRGCSTGSQHLHTMNKEFIMKKIITGLSAMALATGLYAGSCSGTQCNDVMITEIVPTIYGTISVATDADETALSCTALNSKYLYVPNGATGKNAVYSALLTAYTTKKKMRFLVAPDSNGKCQITTLFVQ